MKSGVSPVSGDGHGKRKRHEEGRRDVLRPPVADFKARLKFDKLVSSPICPASWLKGATHLSHLVTR